MLAALHLAFINLAQFVALMFVASINSVSLHISDLLRQWRSVQGHPLRGYIFLIMYKLSRHFFPVNAPVRLATSSKPSMCSDSPPLATSTTSL